MRVTKKQLAIAFGKYYTGTKPGDGMWSYEDQQALDYALGAQSPNSTQFVSIPRNSTMLALNEWLEDVTSGSLYDEDGTFWLSTCEHVSNEQVFAYEGQWPDIPQWATHVCWVGQK